LAKIELNIVALGDFSSVNAQIKALQLQVDSLNKGVAGVGLGSALVKDLNAAQSAFKSTMLSTGQFTAQTVKMSSETEKFGQALVAGKLKISDYFNIITNKAGQAKASMTLLAESQVKLQNSVVVKNKQGFLDVYTPTSFNKIAQAEELVTMKSALMQKAIDGGSTALVNFGKNTQWAGRQLTVGLTMPMVMFGAAAVKSFQATNVELTKLQRLYGEGLTPPSQAQLDKISGQVLNLGKQVAQQMGIAQSATVQVAASFAAMGRQGQNLLDTTYQTQRLSKLGAVDATAATNTIVALQNVYKVSTNDLAGAVNFLSDIQKQTTMTLGDMTEAIPRVGPIMKELGASYKDTAVMLVAMREAGIPASQAANALKSAMASIIAPTSAATKEFASFGINLNAVKTAGGPVQMIESLQQSLSKLAPLAREQLIEKLFGKMQYGRISALLDNFGKAGSQTVNALKIAGATSTELATLANQEMKQATSSVSSQWTRALEGFKATLYPIGQKFVEMGSIVLNVANKIGKAFSDLPSPLKGFFGFLLIGAAIAGPLIMLTGLLSNFAGYLLKGVGLVRQLATGGMTLKELLTPEIIASQKAAELFSNQISNDVSAVDLLNQAVERLTASLAGMSGAMTTGTGDVAVKSAAVIAAASNIGGRLSSDQLPILPSVNIRTNDNFQKMDKAHAGISKTISKEEATAMLPDLTAIQQTRVNQALSAIETGAVKEEEVLFNLLDNFVLNLSHSVNELMKPYAQRPIYNTSGNLIRAGKESKGVSREQFISQELTPSVYTSNILQAQEKGVQVTNEQAAKFSQAMNLITSDILLSDDQFKILKEPELAKAYDIAMQKAIEVFSAMAQNGEKDAAEMLKLAIAFQELRNSTTLEITGPLSTMGIKGGGSSGATQIRSAAFPGISTYEKSGGTRAEISAMSDKIKSAGGAIDQAFADAIFSERQLIVDATGKVAVEAGKEFTTQMQTTIKDSAPAITAAVGSSLEGASVEAAVAGETAGLSFIEKMKGKLTSNKGMGMGLMLGGTMLGQTMSGSKNQTVNTLGTGVTMGANAAGIAMMMGPEIAAMAGPIALGVAGVAIATKELIKYMDDVKAHNAEVAASFKPSSSALSVYGGTMLTATQAVYNFNSANKESASVLSQTAKDVAAIGKLGSSDALKQVGDLLKGGTTAKGVIGTAEQFAAAQVASGMDPKAVSQMVTDLLTYSGQTQYLSTALKEITKNTQDMSTATTTWLNKLKNTDDANILTSTTYKGMSAAQKAYADGLLSTVNIISSADTPFQTVIDKLKALSASSDNTGVAVSSFALALKNSGADAASVAEAYNLVSMGITNMGTAATVYMLNAAGFKVDAKTATGLTQQLKTVIPDYVTNKQKEDEAAAAKKVADDQAQLAKDKKAAEDANSTAATQTKAQKDAVAALGAEEAKNYFAAKNQVKVLDANLALQKQITSELQAQQQYQLSEAQIDSQIRTAVAGGDFMQASLLRQQKSADTSKYNGDTQNQQMQDKIDNLNAQIAIDEEKISALQTNNSNVASATASDQATLTLDQASLNAIKNAGSDKNMTTQINELFKSSGLDFKVFYDKNHVMHVAIDSSIPITVGGAQAPSGSANNAIPFDANTYKKTLDTVTKKSGQDYDQSLKNWNASDYGGADTTRQGVKTFVQAKGIKDGQSFSITQNGKIYEFIMGKDPATGVGTNGNITLVSTGNAGQVWNGSSWVTPKPVTTKATGGHITGPGTGTSDSIPAYLSNGEFVTKAASVNKYGVNFMNAINTGTYNPSFPNVGSMTNPLVSGTMGGSNTYNITVNAGSNASADDIAKTVLNTIQRAQKMTSTNRKVSV